MGDRDQQAAHDGVRSEAGVGVRRTRSDGPTYQPRALIVTVLGAFGRSLGGWFAVADMIELMQGLDIGAQAVRASVSRLKKRGFLVPERVGGAAGYRLTPEAEVILARGDRRIFRTWEPPSEEEWIIVVFSVPEAERERRHVLRSRLSWLGFGNAAPGVWIAPLHLEAEAREMIEAEHLTGYISLFRSRYAGFDELKDEAGRWWDLASLERLYDEFVRAFTPVARRHDRAGEPDLASAFADYVRALTYWRVLPFLDPGLPPEILPRNWSGDRARALFTALHETLAAPALQYVRDVADLRIGAGV